MHLTDDDDRFVRWVEPTCGEFCLPTDAGSIARYPRQPSASPAWRLAVAGEREVAAEVTVTLWPAELRALAAMLAAAVERMEAREG